MELIKDTIQNVIQGWTVHKRRSCDANPEDLLKKVLTKKELKHIKFNYFKKGTLSLYVDSSSWLYSLSLKKEDLLAKLNAQLPAIKDIRLHIGAI